MARGDVGVGVVLDQEGLKNNRGVQTKRYGDDEVMK